MKDFRARRWQQEDRNPMMTVFEKAGRYPDIIDLSIGDPDLKTPQKIIDLAFADAGAGHTKYTDPWGDPELREEIARFYAEEYGVALGEREIFVSTAGCVAMYLVMEAILDPGDEVLIFDPYFSAYATQVRLGGGVPVFVPCREADGWQPDMERAAQYLTPRTKALVINTPNNPTGVCYSRPTLEAVARFARKNDLLVVADDIYTSFCYSEPFLPVLTLPGMKERTIVVESLSKTYAMTGWRIGYLLAPEAVIEQTGKIAELMHSSVNSLAQYAGVAALAGPQDNVAAMREEYRAKRQIVLDGLAGCPVLRLIEPQGAFYAFVDVRLTGLDSGEFADRLLDEERVAVVPGEAFGEEGRGFVRLSYAGDADELREGVARLRAFAERVWNPITGHHTATYHPMEVLA